jgi:DNA-binding transcriptional MerR regulator
MPNDNEYSLQDLADLADVSPRTIRYYVAQGLLPSPGHVGPGARYIDGHLARLRLIRRLQREHLPLAEIRTRLAGLDDETIASLVESDAPKPPESSALDYIRGVLGGSGMPSPPRLSSEGPVAPASRSILAHQSVRAQTTEHIAEPDAAYLRMDDLPAPAEPPAATGPSTPTEPTTQRSQWDRIALSPDIELNIRRPLSRQQNKRVERLIAIAHELLEEDPS